MQIKNLSSIPFEKVVDCFLQAFKNYFVSLPDDVDYWRNRFAAVKVDWALSFGMFDGDKLVGYIINGIGDHNGKLTAYNTGTGVLEEYRGRQIVDQLYDHAFPVFKKRGIQKCLLEVICENSRAIKVYERTGFEVLRKLCSYSGTISSKDSSIFVEKVDYRKILDLNLYNPAYYSWEGSAETILNLGDRVETYFFGEGAIWGYFCIDQNSNILQLDSNGCHKLIEGIAKVSKVVKTKNISEDRTGVISALVSAGLNNSVNQFEMQLML